MADDGKVVIDVEVNKKGFADSIASELKKGVEKTLGVMGSSKKASGGGMGTAIAGGIAGGAIAGGILTAVSFIADMLKDFPIVTAVMKLLKMIIMAF